MEDILDKSFVVYLLTDLTNFKQYVGKTTRMLKIRLKNHRYNKKSYIGRAIRSHGWENFKVEILEECATEIELNAREMYWIKTLNTKHPGGYNLTDGGDGVKGQPGTRKRAIRCLDTGEIFESITAAAKHFNASAKSIYKVCQGERIRAGGYKFEYIDAPLSEEARCREAANRTKAIRCLETGAEYASITEASEQTGIKGRDIGRVCNGLLRTTRGLHFEFVDSELKRQAELNRPPALKKPVRCIELKQIFNSIAEASRATGIGLVSISCTCRGKNRTAGGLHFEFMDDELRRQAELNRPPALKKPVRCIELNRIFNSITEASNATGADSTSISFACRGKYQTAGNYHWQFVTL